MNENIDLCEILKDCPKGWKFWSPIFGEVEFERNYGEKGFVNVSLVEDGSEWSFASDATIFLGNIKSPEIMIYPSREQRDWSKFTPHNLVNQRFKVGDWVVRGDTIAQIFDIQEQYYIGLDINGKDFVSSRFLNDDKIHLWTLQDAKDGNVLVNGSNIFIFHNINNRRLMGYCHVNMDDGNLYNDIGKNECFCTIDAPVTPATKEQRDILFKKIKERRDNIYIYMNKNIDLTKILKDCPEGTKLYSTIYGDVKFHHIVTCSAYPIIIKNDNGAFSVTKYGMHIIDYEDNAECTLFPSKEQRDWNKFAAPWYKKDKLIKPRFKIGDWIVTTENKVLQITSIEGTSYRFNNKSHYWEICYCDEQCHLWTINDAKDGDVVQLGQVIAIFKKYIGREKCICYCSFCKDVGFEIPIENGDDNVYGCHNASPVTKEQRDALMKTMNEAGYEWDVEKKELKKLVPNKFDPKTLKPFDKVLVRSFKSSKWRCEHFSYFKEGDAHPYMASTSYAFCIPYNDETKHLVGTTEEAPEYYRYWEED